MKMFETYMRIRFTSYFESFNFTEIRAISSSPGILSHSEAQVEVDPEQEVGADPSQGHGRANSLEMFELLTRLQSSRLDDQRCSMPLTPVPQPRLQLQEQQEQEQTENPQQQNTLIRSESKTRYGS